MEYVIWGIPPGQYDEQVLYTKATSAESAARVKAVLEQKHNCTAVRVQVLDLSVNPASMFGRKCLASRQ